MNRLKIVFLMTLLALLFVGVGGLIDGRQGLVMAFLIALVMNAFSYFFSDRMVLAIYGAREVNELFSTHPPTEKRIARLEEMARGGIRPR